MNLNQTQIINLLDQLGIKHKNKANNNWLPILCPQHLDHNYGNASINLTSGVIHCFACGAKLNINKLNKNNNIIEETRKKIVIKKEKPKKYLIIKDQNYHFTHIPLNPEKYQYTKLRGFTTEFCEKFNIRLCLSGLYDEYMIIPIIDIKKNISEFEARKIKEYEMLKKVLNCDLPLSKLKVIFKQQKKQYDKNDFDIQYLLKKKVLYVSGAQLNKTLWNIDNLDYSIPLYLVEGFGSIPKIYNNITKNVTCTFGSNISNYQIEYLKKFNDIIVIPDYDEAGNKMLEKLHVHLKNVKVISIKSEDTQKIYIKEIVEKTPISLSDIIYMNFFKKI